MQTANHSDNMSFFAQTIINNKYAHTKSNGNKETWNEIAERVAEGITRKYFPDRTERIKNRIRKRQFMPGGRYLYATGKKYQQINNCFLFRADDSREGWGELSSKVTNSLMTGGGIGVTYSSLREEGAKVGGLGGTSTGPIALAQIVNETGRFIMQGGSRRSAIWGGLAWDHPDIFKWTELKDWPDWLVERKKIDFNTPAPMDGTNISINLDNTFFAAYADESHPKHRMAYDVYWKSVAHALRTGEPGWAINVGDKTGEDLRNACTELCTADDSDCCNLASLNMARFDTIEEWEAAVEDGIAFLICGTLCSKLPIPRMYDIREKNRRLGLGLMGVHEWLLRRNKRYGPDDELKKWLEIYSKSTKIAHDLERMLGISPSAATRAVAPCGTISIAAETTSASEPIFAIGVKRRYLVGQKWHAQYIVDASAERLISQGCDPSLIEDAYDLAEDYERRINFQAWIQQYVDHGISSTINLPQWGSSVNNENTVKNFGNCLLKYLPGVRGMTVYPDGARGGQPLNRVSYQDAKKYLGKEMVEDGEICESVVEEYGNERACVNGVCGL